MKADENSAALLYEIATQLLRDDPVLRGSVQQLILNHLKEAGFKDLSQSLKEASQKPYAYEVEKSEGGTL